MATSNTTATTSLEHSEFRLWFNTILLSLGIFFFSSLYLFVRRGNYDFFIANKAFATTSLVLIGLSLALSGLCYFWNFLDSKIVYRKHLGLAGFAFAIVHVIVSFFFLSGRFTYPEWFSGHFLSVMFGLLALLVLCFMALISNRWARMELGALLWRRLLRLGYLVLILVAAHFALLKYGEWTKWFQTPDPFLPPLSLLEMIFTLLVIGLRLAVWIDTVRNRNSAAPRLSQN
ncbi:MAG: ferric reductase-like transmembrane domain-containing protein [bacterium]|nr:ferric reductase-like transmembrane domain-containing protein [bacterium]